MEHEQQLEALAEAAESCRGCNGTGNVPERAYPPGVAITTCSTCGGTGRIVLFPSLRVACLTSCTHHDYSLCGGRRWVPEPDVEKACWRILHTLYHSTKAHTISHIDFGPTSYPFVKRGETDLIAFTQGGYVQGEWDEKDIIKAYGRSFEEAVIRATLTWAKEQHALPLLD